MKTLLTLLVFITACSTEPTPETDTSSIDMGGDATDVVVPKVDLENKIENSWKFVMREPRADVLDCGGIKYPDVDWLCTFDYDGIKDVLYFRNSPIECIENEESALPRYESDFYRNFKNNVTRYTAAEYDSGGEDKNDSLTFSYGETTIRYYHSSFGLDVKKCQAMDCLQAYDDEGEFREDGCTPERTLPIVCLPVKSGESYDETSFDDNFMKCPGEGEVTEE